MSNCIVGIHVSRLIYMVVKFPGHLEKVACLCVQVGMIDGNIYSLLLFLRYFPILANFNNLIFAFPSISLGAPGLCRFGENAYLFSGGSWEHW